MSDVVSITVRSTQQHFLLTIKVLLELLQLVVCYYPHPLVDRSTRRLGRSQAVTGSLLHSTTQQALRTEELSIHLIAPTVDLSHHPSTSHHSDVLLRSASSSIRVVTIIAYEGS